MNTTVVLRTIHENEIGLLHTCLEDLAQHHNMVSTNFKGYYPRISNEEVLEVFEQHVKSGKSRIAVVQEEDSIIGFCKCDIEDNKKHGKLDYLAVLKSYRGNGYGGMLMDWAMDFFHRNEVEKIAITVVEGNETIHLYEKYGFKIASHVMWKVP